MGFAVNDSGAARAGGIMQSLGLVGALLGAMLGAVIWGLGFGGPGGMEGSWVALLVGALTGSGCALLGGRGMKMALLAGFLAVAAMLGGRVLGAWIVLNREWGWKDRQAITAGALRRAPFEDATYDRMLRQIGEFKETPPDQMESFILRWGYELGEPDRQVSALELEHFQSDVAPHLTAWASKLPKQNEAREAYYDIVARGYERHFKATTPLWQIARPPLDLVDLLFAIGGLVVAVAVVETVTEKARMAREAAERAARQKAERKPLPRGKPAPTKQGEA